MYMRKAPCPTGQGALRLFEKVSAPQARIQTESSGETAAFISSDPIDQSAMPSSCRFATAMPFCASSEVNFSSSDTRNTM